MYIFRHITHMERSEGAHEKRVSAVEKSRETLFFRRFFIYLFIYFCFSRLLSCVLIRPRQKDAINV